MSDEIKPTNEREAKSIGGSVDRVELRNDVGRTVVMSARKFLSIVEACERRGDITPQDKDAADRYYFDWVTGCGVSSIVPGYREYTDPSTGGAQDDGAVRRSFHYRRFITAESLLGHHLRPVATHVILEMPLAGADRPPTLTEWGRHRGPYHQDKRAHAYALAELIAALAVLRDTYNI